MCKVTINPGGADVVMTIERLFGKRRINSDGFLTLAVTIDGLSQYERTVVEKTFDGQGHELIIEE
jgi:hypothetical protein